MPPALGRFSTITVWPSGLPIACAVTRATVSVGPPAAYGTTIEMLRFGYCCAVAVAPEKTSAVETAIREKRFIDSLQIGTFEWRARRDSNPRPLASEANTLIR